LQQWKERAAIRFLFFFTWYRNPWLPSAPSCLSVAAKQQVTKPRRSPVYFKHVPASKRRIFGERGKNGDMKEKATYAVLDTFRHSEDTLTGLGISAYKQSIYKQPESIALQVPQRLNTER